MPYANQNRGLFGRTSGPLSAFPEPEKPKGLFGQPNGPLSAFPEQQPQAQPQAQPQRRKPNVGKAIAGTIGDYLMQRQGMAPIYAPQMLQQQQARAAQQAAQLKRAQDLADYETKQQIDQRYDAPDVPTIQQNAEYIERTEGPEAAAEYRRNYGRQPQQPNVVNIPGLGTFMGTPEEVMQQIQALTRGGQPDEGMDELPEGYQVRGGGGGNATGGFRP